MNPDKWSIVSYFKENDRNFLTSHHIDSYNTLLTNQFGKIFRQFSPINLEYPADSTIEMYKNSGLKENYKQKLSIYLGANIREEGDEISIINDGSQFKISRPVLEEIAEDGTKYTKPLYPNECRLKNLTYSSTLYIDILLKFSKDTLDGENIELDKYLSINTFEDIDTGTDYKYEISFPSDKTNFNGTEFNLFKTKDALIHQYRNVPLGLIPIMLHSQICILSGQSNDTLLDMGECPYGQGGYFIIDGKEKVIVAQERQTENKIFISELKDDTNYSYKLEIRSCLEDKLEPARITNLFIHKSKKIYNSYFNREIFQLNGKDSIYFNIGDKVTLKGGGDEDNTVYTIKRIFYSDNKVVLLDEVEGLTSTNFIQEIVFQDRDESSKNNLLYCNIDKKKKNNSEIQLGNNIIRVELPNIEKKIPLFILFRALGILSDKKILSIILYNIDKNNKSSKSYINFLKNTIKESRYIQTQKQAFIFLICLYKKIRITNELLYSDNMINTDDKNTIMNILLNYFVPHIKGGLINKGYYLGYMVKKLVDTNLKIIKPTDRDSYIYKRVDISGYLLSNLYRDLLFRYKMDITYKINQKFQGIIDEKSSENKLVYLENQLNINNISSIFNSRLLSDGIMYAFKNCWGMKNSTCKEGVVQDLNIISTLGTLSNLRRINTPLSKSCKMRAPHSLHGSSWGIMCPAETPDGQNVGVRKNLAIMANISFGCNSFPLELLLTKLGLIKICYTYPTHLYNKCKIFINERLQGIHPYPDNLFHQLKVLKRNGLLNVYTSISWNIINNEIKLNTDSGRSCRPLLVVKNNKTLWNLDWKTRMDNYNYKCLVVYENDKNIEFDITVEDWLNLKINTEKIIEFFNKKLMNQTEIPKMIIVDIRSKWNILLSGLKRFYPNYKVKFEETDTETETETGTGTETETILLDKIYEADLSKYDHKVYLDNLNMKSLMDNGGIVEYIDIEESDNSIIAFNPEYLETEKIYHYCEINPCMILGLLGNMIPFTGSNQAPRNLFSCGQSKQALGVFATNFQNRMDTKSQILLYPQMSIIDTKVSRLVGINKLPYGQNAIVAIACYSGYNQDDSIIMNKNSIERGLFNSIKYRTYVEQEDEVENKVFKRFGKPNFKNTEGIKPGNYNYLRGEDSGLYEGIIREGVRVTENDVLIGISIKTNRYTDDGEEIYIDNSLFVKRNESGIVDKVYVGKDENGFKFCKIRLRSDKIPIVGDKFCSRHGQKGVIGIKIEQENMPFTEDGLVPDLIINPQAFPKRMTIGQFIECLFAKTMTIKGTFGDASAFEKVDINSISHILQGLNFEKNCNEIMYNGFDGKQMDCKIFIGPTYYLRLQHQVADKMYSRSEGGVASLTHQPVGGRALGGGLRIGEMERDAMLAHGISFFLKESMMERSDKYEMWIDNKSGLPAIVNQNKHIYKCFGSYRTIEYIDSNTNEPVKKQINVAKSGISLVEIPYSMKLFIQEILSMGIAPRLVTSNLVSQWKHNLNNKDKEVTIKKDIMKPLIYFHNIIEDIIVAGIKNISSGGNLSLLDLTVKKSNMRRWYSSYINEKEYRNNFGLENKFIIGLNNKIRIIESVKEKYNNLKKQNSSLGTWSKNSNLNIFSTDFCLDFFPNKSESIKSLFPPLNNYGAYGELKYDDVGKTSISKPIYCNEIITLLKFYLKDLDDLTILDGTGGLGGDSIFFSPFVKKIISCENDPERFKLLENNINVYRKYNNYNNIELINSDVNQYLKIIENPQNINLLYFDPPWGGSDWKNEDQLIYRDSKIFQSKIGPFNLLKNKDLNRFSNLDLIIFKLPSLNKKNKINRMNKSLGDISDIQIKQGTRVEVNISEIDPSKVDSFLPGKITRVNEDGSFNIRFDNNYFNNLKDKHNRNRNRGIKKSKIRIELNSYLNELKLLKNTFKSRYKIWWKDLYEYLILFVMPIESVKFKYIYNKINRNNSFSYYLQKNNKKIIRKLDLITNFYGIHRAFESEIKLENTLRNISRFLKPNSYCVISSLDGKKILDKLNSSENGKINGYVTNNKEKELVWEFAKNKHHEYPEELDTNYNLTFKVFIKSLSDNFTEEFLVSPKLLIQKASEFDLSILSDYQTKKNFKFLDSGYGNYKNIYETYYPKTNNNLDISKYKDLLELSELHSYFIFYKKDNEIKDNICQLTNKNYSLINKDYIYYISNEKEKEDYLLRERFYLGSNSGKNIGLISKNNIFNKKDNILENYLGQLLDSKEYFTPNNNSFNYTLDFLLNKYKSGIYVKIKDGKLIIFRYFYNKNYDNNLFKSGEFLIHLNPRYKNYDNYFKIKNISENKILDKSKWVVNNCLVNLLEDVDISYYEWKSMLIDFLNSKTNIPDVEFFINTQHYPVLKEDMNENDNVFIPILSKCSGDKFKDLILPSTTDYLLSNEKCITINKKRFGIDNIITNWDKKKSNGIFIGSSAGCENPNQRIKLIKISRQLNDKKILVGVLTHWDTSDIINKDNELGFSSEKEESKIQPEPINKVNLLENISKSKYIFYIDGWGADDIYTEYLLTKSLIFKVESNFNYKLWYFDLLTGCNLENIYNLWESNDIDNAEKEWEKELSKNPDHIIVRNNFDIEYIKFLIDWCNKHEDSCKLIAESGYSFYHKIILNNGINDYLEIMVHKISNSQVNIKPNLLTVTKPIPSIYEIKLRVFPTVDYNIFKKYIQSIEFETNTTFSNIHSISDNDIEKIQITISGTINGIKQTEILINNILTLKDFEIKIPSSIKLFEYDFKDKQLVYYNNYYFSKEIIGNDTSLNFLRRIFDNNSIENILKFIDSRKDSDELYSYFKFKKQIKKITLVKKGVSLFILFNNVLNTINNNINFIQNTYQNILNHYEIVLSDDSYLINLNCRSFNKKVLEIILRDIFREETRYYSTDSNINLEREYSIIEEKIILKKLMFILPYRNTVDTDEITENRELQLIKFINTINKYLKNDYKDVIVNFIVLNQINTGTPSVKEIINDQGTFKFNRGSLINVGFNIVRHFNKFNPTKRFNQVIIHDIDLIPSLKIFKEYLYETNGANHLANNWTRYNNINGLEYFGGAISINIDNFFKSGGYPNNYWGWGNEDIVFKDRLLSNNITVSELGNYELQYKDLEDIPTIEEKENKISKESGGINNYSQINYEVVLSKYSNCKQRDFYQVNYSKEIGKGDINKLENCVIFDVLLNELSYPLFTHNETKIINNFRNQLGKSLSGISVSEISIEYLKEKFLLDKYEDLLWKPLLELHKIKYDKIVTDNRDLNVHPNQFTITINPSLDPLKLENLFYIFGLFLYELNNISIDNTYLKIIKQSPLPIPSLNSDINYQIFNQNNNFIIVNSLRVDNKFVYKKTQENTWNKFYVFRNRLFKEITVNELEITKQTITKLGELFNIKGVPKPIINLPNVSNIIQINNLGIFHHTKEDYCFIMIFNTSNQKWEGIMENTPNWNKITEDIYKFNDLMINLRLIYFYLIKEKI